MPVIGLIPAAGHATRLQPLSGSKELLEVGGRPVIAYLVDRMRRAEADRIVVVTRPDKADVLAYAEDAGLEVRTGEPSTVSRSLLLGLEEAAAQDTCLLGFPDTLWEPVDGFEVLQARLRAGTEAVLGVFDSREPERSDVVELDGDRVTGVAVKPSQPRGSLIWGCAVARAEALAGLEEHDEPGNLFDALARTGRVLGVRLEGAMIDIGTEEALARARSLQRA